MRDLIRSAARGTVKVSTGKTGTGFLVTGGYVVTCAHVLDGASSAAISSTYLGTTTAEVVEVDEANDLALLFTNLTRLPCLELGTYRDTAVGDDVVFLGYPIGMNTLGAHRAMVSHRGEIQFRELPRPVQTLILDGSVNKGNSGGPVLEPSTGLVVGVVNAKLGDLPGRLQEFRRAREIVRGLGLGGGVQFGVVEFDDGQKVTSFDPAETSDTLAEVIDFLENYTNAGIGYALSVDYVSQLILRVDSQK